MFSLIRGKTPPIRGNNARSIAVLQRIRLGGLDQWATIRGHDARNPILLHLHGGPGMSEMGAIRHFLPQLEEHFVVVHWSQRGAGKSYSREIPDDSMNLSRFVSDAEELILYLLARFEQQKVFLMGQSWGTGIGMRLVQRRPDLVQAYVGVNQVVDRAREELLSYRAALHTARERGNRKAVAQLQAIGEPTDGLWPTLEGTLVHKTWIRNLGMITRESGHYKELAKAVALNPELTTRDVLRLFTRMRWNMQLLWDEFCGVNLFREIPEVAVPVYFVAGKHDYITSPALESQYIETLAAPKKEFVLFEDSGHMACYEEPKRFLEVMLQVKGEGALAHSHTE